MLLPRELKADGLFQPGTFPVHPSLGYDYMVVDPVGAFVDAIITSKERDDCMAKYPWDIDKHLFTDSGGSYDVCQRFVEQQVAVIKKKDGKEVLNYKVYYYDEISFYTEDGRLSFNRTVRQPGSSGKLDR